MSGQASEGEPQNEDKLFSDKVQDRLSVSATDCCIVCFDGTKYPVHKAKLQEQSKVLRGMLSDVASVAEVPLLDEDAAAVRLLIGGMYDTNTPISWSTVEPLLELARKYDVEDISLNCERFLMAERMYTSSVPRFMALSCTFALEAVVQRCQDFIAADGHFADIVRAHGATWCKDLPGAVVTDMMNRYQRSLHEEMKDKISRYQKLNDYVLNTVIGVGYNSERRQPYNDKRRELGLLAIF